MAGVLRKQKQAILTLLVTTHTLNCAHFQKKGTLQGVVGKNLDVGKNCKKAFDAVSASESPTLIR